jgi:hypothetical protein
VEVDVEEAMKHLNGPALEVPLVLFQALPGRHRDVFVLAYLCRESERTANQQTGWFSCPTKEMQKRLRMGASTLNRSIGRLQMLGFIGVSHRKQFPFILRLRIKGDAITAVQPTARH